MTKFFLEQSHQPIKKNKHPDYRIVSYRKLKKLLQAQHIHGINKIIRKLKKIENEQVVDKQLVNNLQSQLIFHKTIKKQSIKQIAVYIMKHALQVSNLEIPAITKEVNVQEIESLENRVNAEPNLKKFIEEVVQSKHGKQIVENLSTLVSIVTKKKVIKKQRQKTRRVRKLEVKKHQIDNKEQKKIQQELQQEIQPSKEESIDIQQQQRLNKVESKPKYKQYFKNNYEKKERTIFKKTGRNKFFEEKKLKRYPELNRPHNNHQKIQRFSSKQNPIKKQQHPSWQAKKKQKQEMFIDMNAFKGKRILL